MEVPLFPKEMINAGSSPVWGTIPFEMKNMTRPTLFLDMDGVLNRSMTFNHPEDPDSKWKVRIDPIDLELVQNLNLVTAAFPGGIDIVISSTWRKNYTTAVMTNLLMKSGLRDFEVVGATPVLHVRRGREIRDWLLDHPEVNAGKWCIVDDDNDMLPAQQNRFVNTTFKEGLTVEKANEIIKILTFGEK